MSLTSLAGNLETTTTSTFLDPQRIKKFGSTSTNFQEFLANSPYANIKKPFYSPRNQTVTQKGEYSIAFNDVVLQLPRQKKSNEPIINEPLQISPIPASQEDCSIIDTSMFQNPLEADTLKFSKVNLNLGENINPNRPHINKHRIIRASNAYNQGFDSPKASMTDHETKFMVKELQARIISMEKEMLKIKKENHDLREENKKYKDNLKMVVQEQEKASKMKELYEKKISSLRENCVNNEQAVNSLKEILSLQDVEYHDRHSKERGATLQNVDAGAPSQRTQRHFRTLSNIDMAKVNRVSSIEANLESKENYQTPAAAKKSLRVDTNMKDGQSHLLKRRNSNTFNKNLKVAVKS